MACGSCGQRYRPPVVTVQPVKGTSRGVVKAPQNVPQQMALPLKEPTPNPVVGTSGPTKKHE